MGWVSMQEDILKRFEREVNLIDDFLRQNPTSNKTDEETLQKTKKILHRIKVHASFVDDVDTQAADGKLSEADYNSFRDLVKEHLHLSAEFVELVNEKELLKHEVKKLKSELTNLPQLIGDLKVKSSLVSSLQSEIRRLKKEKKDLESRKYKFDSNTGFSGVNSRNLTVGKTKSQPVIASKLNSQKLMSCEICGSSFPDKAMASHIRSCANIQSLKQSLFSKCKFCGGLFRNSYVRKHETLECAKKIES